MFTLRKLELQNFLSHKKTTIEFEEGTYIIIGENGAGKTSLLRGLFYGIFGQDVEGIPKEQLIKKGELTCRVAVEFIYKQSRFRIERSFSRLDRRTEARIYKDGRLLAMNATQVKEVLNSIRIDHEVFRNAIYVPQGEIVSFLLEGPKVRKKILNKLLNLEETTQKHNALKLCYSNLKRVLETKIEKLKYFEKVEQEKEELERRLEEIEKLLVEKRSTLDQLKSEEAEVSKVYETLRQVSFMEHQKAELEKELEKIKDELKNLGSKEELFERKIELENETSVFKDVEKIISRAEELVRVKSEEELTKREIATLSKDEQTLNTKNEDLKRIQKRLEEIQQLLSEKTGLSKTLEEKYNKLLGLKDEFLKVKGLTERMKEELGKLNLPELEKEYLQKKSILEKTEQRIFELSNEEAKLRAELEELRKKEEVLKTARENKCPICGSVLDENHREKLIGDIRQAIAVKDEELRRISESLKVERERLEKEQKEERKLAVLVERGKQLEKSLQELLKKEVPFDELKLKSVESERVKNLKEIEKLRKEYELLKKQEGKLLSEIKELENRAKLLEEKRNLLNNLEEKERILIEELGKIKVKVKERAGREISSLSEARSYYNELLKKREELTKIEERINSISRLEKELADKENRLKDLKDKIAALRSSVGEGLSLDAVSEKLESLRKAVNELTSEVGKLEGEQKAIRNEVKKKERELQEREVLETYLGALKDAVNSVDKLVKAFHPENGFLSLARKEYLPEVKRYCEEIFKDFGFHFGEIKLTEDLTAFAGGPYGGEFSVRELSGGQQVAFALSLKFALAKYFNNNLELLILDEPTIHLDEERVNFLADILEGLKGNIKQLIVVTHDSKLERIGDFILRIKNVGGTSCVEVRGG